MKVIVCPYCGSLLESRLIKIYKTEKKRKYDILISLKCKEIKCGYVKNIAYVISKNNIELY